jgi:predicted RNase H-like nuclease
MILGIDGANGGWLVAEREGEKDCEFEYYPSFFSVWKNYALEADEKPDRILVDIPIGLRNDGEPRRCDTEARKRARSSTVFPTPSRPAVYESTYEGAKETNERVTDGKTSLNTQTWSIAPLIREADEILDEYGGVRGVVRESHPEVCFWALNGRETVESKKDTQDGFEERVGILEDHEREAEEIVGNAVDKYSKSGVSRDDIVDAFALAVTAQGELDTLPDDPPTDGRALPMEMMFRADL